MRHNQTTCQTGSADEEQRKIEAEITTLTSELETHHENATRSHEYCIATTSRCKKESQLLEAKQYKTEQKVDTLKMLQHNFMAVLSADYQM